MAIELMTFGNLLTLLNSISSESIDEFKLDRWARKRIGPDKFKKLTNWMHCIRDVRNHCAHHNRLFNRNFPAPDGILRNLNKDIELISVEGSIKPQKQLNRLYTALACMQVISRKSGLTGIGPELANLFDSYPETANHLASMGFPQTWREEELFFPTPKQ
jgi:abortive infection bacteriophage resistance protein